MARPVNAEERQKRIREVDAVVDSIISKNEKLTYESIASGIGVSKAYLTKKKNGQKNYLGQYVEEVMESFADYNGQFAALTETTRENLRLRRENKRLMAMNKKLAEDYAKKCKELEDLRVTIDTILAADYERRKQEIGRTG